MLRRRHGDEDDLRVIDAFLDAVSKAESLRGNVAMHDFLQSRLVNRNLALPKQFDFARGRYRRR